MPKKPPPPKPAPTLGELLHRLRNLAPYISDPVVADALKTIAALLEHLPGAAKAADDHAEHLRKEAEAASEEDE